MWFILGTIYLFTASVQAVDYDVFHNCSREPFCARFRNQVLDSDTQFFANVSAAVRYLNTVQIPLINGNGTTMTLELSILFDQKMRIRILEKVQRRYLIMDVIYPLDKRDYVPTIEHTSDDTLTVTAVRAPDDKIVLRSGPPFMVECYHKNQLETVLNGDRLVMEDYDVSQAYSFTMEFEGASRLYGLAHHSHQLALKETADGSSDPYRLKNVNNYGYDANSTTALYSSIPVLYGYSANFSSGVLVHNAAQMFVDISYTGDRPSAYFMVECGIFDLILFLGPELRDTVRQYRSMTGNTRMPQLWVFGYHQNRYTYWTQEEVKEVVARMDDADIPLDVVFLDSGYTNRNRYFEWNPENFSDPLEMQQNVSATGRHLITVTNPHVAVSLDHEIYVAAKELDFYIKNPDGSDYRGVSKAGDSVWIDFLIPTARAWYAFLFQFKTFAGTTEAIGGLCNDWNEPSVIDDTTERTLPPNVLHYDQIEDREVHNMYGLMNVKATDAALSIRDLYKKRSFVLSRSHFPGSQRYAAVWTGDNVADWYHLQNSVSECLTFNLLLTVLCGANVGGFYNEPTDELLQRWYQTAIWIPYFMANSNDDTARREPYLLSEEVQAVVRLAIKTRYKHIPYWYRLMFDHTQIGDPLIRPLFYSYPGLIDHDDHILIGEEILSRPVLEPGVDQVEVVFPGNNTWYRVDDDSWKIYQGNTIQNITVNITTSPYFYRGGSIIPRMDIERPSTTQMRTDPFQLYVNLDADNNAQGLLYFDDYESLDYIHISFFYSRLTYDAATNGIRFEHVTGNPDGFDPRIQSITIHREGENGGTVGESFTSTSDGTPLQNIRIVENLFPKEKNGFAMYL